MAGKLLAVSKVNEILRLSELGLRERAIARTLRCSRHTVRKILAEGNASEDPVVIEEERGWAALLDWQGVHNELIKGVPFQVLWEENYEAKRVPVKYNGFWKQYQKRFPNLPLSMHRVFAPGSRTEIDYCDGIELLNPVTGELEKTELFVGVLCHSRYVFAEFTLSQKSADFLSSHVRMFEWFGGVTEVIAPDNLRSAVSKAHRYDPVMNPAYTRLADHYATAVVPARARKPKDKAIVERSIQIFQRWFYFRVRHRTFTSLMELNQCLKQHLVIFHAKEHRIFKKSRQEMFESERSALKPLPTSRYEVAIHWRATPHSDCHLVFEKNFYSAPHTLRAKELDIWATPGAVEILHEGNRVAFHLRGKGHGEYITCNEHYPQSIQAYTEATPQFVLSLAEKIGPHTLQLISGLISPKQPLRYLRRAQGITRLAKVYGREKLEAAAQKANTFGQNTYPFIEKLLKNGQIEKPVSRPINRGSNPFLRGEELLQ